MKRQKTFASAISFEKYRKPTKRELFLAEMEQIVPWKELCARLEPFYPKEGRGRPPIGLERMLRIHFLQNWFNLSDRGVEEALYDVESMRRFARIDLGNEPVPDETTICKFRHLLETHKLAEKLFEAVNLHLASRGLKLSEGTIVDATIIHAPSSTKNREKKRDPEMHSTKKGNQYYFGMKVHVGVDKESKQVHSLVTTPANVHDSTRIGELLHGEEKEVRGDSAYMGKTEEIRTKAPRAVDYTQKRATKHKKLTEEEKEQNRLLSKVRSRVEHVFHVVKCVFGFTKVRYKGLAKNTGVVYVLFALCNLYMARGFLLSTGG
ncbi:IS5 family transposase [Aminiphilus circumscriptus]|uniref:IS5 family transposase n=1 Tax=Aminiphilus circumscriptus TaxID=290732 RepID=UPI0004785B66|nr:IS5 family transposase [Aminiphilus circumscriptus]